MMGLFLAIFMNAIPALSQALFGDVKIPTKLYDEAKSNFNKIVGNIKGWWKNIRKD
jgi:hypothetical protein